MGISEWSSWLAIAISLAALVLSWLAFRQKARYHPQPKLVLEWDEVTTARKFPMQRVHVADHGDAAARDLRLLVETTARYPRSWEDRVALEPGEFWICDIPLVDGLDWGYGGLGQTFIATGPEPRPVRPVARLTWRQPPFGGRVQSMRVRVPES